MKLKTVPLVILLSIIFLGSCTKLNDEFSVKPEPNSSVNSKNFKSAPVYLVSQDFESASKTSYSAATVTFGTESWYLDDALLGTSASDRKMDNKSVRIRKKGSVEMLYDVQNAQTVSFYYAVYGGDRSSNFNVDYSTDGGNSWTNLGSGKASSTTLQQVSFDVPVTGTVRFRVSKTSGGKTRINIDNFQVTEADASTVSTASLSEDFESASKTSYAAATITINSNDWYLDDALIGSLSSDRKNGSKSVRVRNTGALEMQFDITDPTTVSFYYAKYGSDGNSDLDLQYSTNGGSSWTTANSYSVTSTTLTKANLDVNLSGSVRFRILKISGGSARFNIDDFVVLSSTGGGNVNPGDTTTATRDDNMALGNPSNAVSGTAYPTNYLMVKAQYDLSYNTETNCPNWVSWHLSSAWLGTTSRYSGNFYSDPDLPSIWYAVVHSDYTNSGFDRGHMCPSADRTGSYDDNKATFTTTNIVPQSPYNNQRAWKYLESYCRTLAGEGYEMYIIAGPTGTGGTGTYGYATSIAGGKINVPNAVWKIVVVLPNGDNDLSRVTTTTPVIAVYMPNEDLGTTPWTNYCTTVDYIESKTGYNFLSNVPSNIQDIIEAKVYDNSL